MNKKICINQFFKSKSKREIVDRYIQSCYTWRKFKFNNKRRLWHIRNDQTLKRWIEREGVRI